MGTEERARFGGKSEDRGQRIKQRREDLGLTQYAFAKDRGLNLNTLRRWEEGYAFQNPDMARKAADALGWTLDELLGDDPAARQAIAEAERGTVTASADARLSRVEAQIRELAKTIGSPPADGATSLLEAFARLDATLLGILGRLDSLDEAMADLRRRGSTEDDAGAGSASTG